MVFYVKNYLKKNNISRHFYFYLLFLKKKLIKRERQKDKAEKDKAEKYKR